MKDTAPAETGQKNLGSILAWILFAPTIVLTISCLGVVISILIELSNSGGYAYAAIIVIGPSLILSMAGAGVILGGLFFLDHLIWKRHQRTRAWLPICLIALPQWGVILFFALMASPLPDIYQNLQRESLQHQGQAVMQALQVDDLNAFNAALAACEKQCKLLLDANTSRSEQLAERAISANAMRILDSLIAAEAGKRGGSWLNASSALSSCTQDGLCTRLIYEHAASVGNAPAWKRLLAHSNNIDRIAALNAATQANRPDLMELVYELGLRLDTRSPICDSSASVVGLECSPPSQIGCSLISTARNSAAHESLVWLKAHGALKTCPNR